MTYIPGTGPQVRGRMLLMISLWKRVMLTLVMLIPTPILHTLQSIFPAARLSLCPAACSAAHLETRLTLHTEHVGVGCDWWDTRII